MDECWGLITARGIGVEWKMRSTLGTSKHNSGASICFYAASKNVSEELVMITPRHFFSSKKKESAELYMPSVLSNISKQHAQNLRPVFWLSTAERTSPPWGEGPVNLTIKFNLYLGGEKGSEELYKPSVSSSFLSLSCWYSKVSVKSDFSNIYHTAGRVVQRDYMQTHAHSHSQLSKQKYTQMLFLNSRGQACQVKTLLWEV